MFLLVAVYQYTNRLLFIVQFTNWIFVLLRFLATLLGFMLALPAYAETLNMGIRNLSFTVAGVNLTTRVFYPTAELSKPTKFGPWLINASLNANPLSGSYPLVVISHGLGGNDWNHYLLAQQLVHAGFVVGAARHPDDLMRVGRQEILVLRPLEVRASIDKILADETLKQIIDSEKIGAFGFSQGGLTILLSLGAKAKHQRLIDHCIAQEESDEEFCTGKSAGFWSRAGNLARRLFYDVPEVDLTSDVSDNRIKFAIVAAPVGVPITDLSSVTTPVWIIRAGADNVLKYPFHAEYINGALGANHEYSVIENIEHYAFLSPFPEQIRDEVGIPARDPKGFDRKEFLRVLNEKIVEKFKSQLKD